MSEEKQYILRKPVVALQRKDLQAGAFVIEAFPDEIYVKNFIGYDMSCMPKNVFNELFVELDREQLKQQLDDIISDIGSHYWNNDQVFREDRERFAEDILALFLGEQTKEQ